MTSPLPRAVAALERGLAAGLHPGAQLYVSRHGAPVASIALGEARPGVPMDEGTLALWLSATKPVAAVAIAQLWERGLLALDDPICRHIPEFAAGGKGGITVRHALTHTGGFRLLRLGWPEAPWEAIVARICAAKREPGWVPGHKAGYHLTSSWFVLGELVRRLDGRPFERYVREEIFEPLGMDACWVGMPVERYRAESHRLAVWFATEQRPPRPHPWHQELFVTRCSPGGNGRGPMRELGRLYEMLLAGGALGGRRVLRPQTVEALVARHRVGMLDHTFQHVMDWGLGVIPNSAPGTGDPGLPYHYGRHASRRAYGHSGYRSTVALADPEHGLAIALAVNGTPADADHRRRFAEVLEAIYEDLGG